MATSAAAAMVSLEAPASRSTVSVEVTKPSHRPSAHCRWLACQLCEGTSGCCTVDDIRCARIDSPPEPLLTAAGWPSGPSGRPSPRPWSAPR